MQAPFYKEYVDKHVVATLVDEHADDPPGHATQTADDKK